MKYCKPHENATKKPSNAYSQSKKLSIFSDFIFCDKAKSHFVIKAKLLRHENMTMNWTSLHSLQRQTFPAVLPPANKHDNSCLKSYLLEIFAISALGPKN